MSVPFLFVTLLGAAACDRNGNGNSFDREKSGPAVGDDDAPIPVGRDQSANVRAVNGGAAGTGPSESSTPAGGTGRGGSGGGSGGSRAGSTMR